jgi:hypothetical protein
MNIKHHGMLLNTWARGSGGTTHGLKALASSRHPGVVNAVLANGLFHAMKSRITIDVWWALGSSANGDAIVSLALFCPDSGCSPPVPCVAGNGGEYFSFPLLATPRTKDPNGNGTSIRSISLLQSLQIDLRNLIHS